MVIVERQGVVPVTTPKEIYKFIFPIMHGDADHYDYEEVLVTPSDLPKMVQLLEEMNVKKWYDGDDQFTAYPTLSYFFNPEDFPHDITYVDVQARLKWPSEAYYYNKEGVLYIVNIRVV